MSVLETIDLGFSCGSYSMHAYASMTGNMIAPFRPILKPTVVAHKLCATSYHSIDKHNKQGFVHPQLRLSFLCHNISRILFYGADCACFPVQNLVELREVGNSIFPNLDL